MSLFSYLLLWGCIVITFSIKWLQNDETAVDIDQYMHYKTSYGNLLVIG
jgi:hypothetical protein